MVMWMYLNRERNSPSVHNHLSKSKGKWRDMDRFSRKSDSYLSPCISPLVSSSLFV